MNKTFEILRRSHRFMLLMGMVALLILSFLVTRPPDLLAATLKPQTCTFYSDVSYSVVTGYAGYNCNGTISWRNGTITAYRICDYDYCCGTMWC